LAKKVAGWRIFSTVIWQSELKRMNEREFETIFEEHKNAVYHFAWRMTNSQAVADDISQDVFLILLRGEVELDQSRGSIRALLLGIARRLVWRLWRQDRRWSSLDDDAYFAEALNVDSIDMQEAVSAAVAALPPLQREVLILATYQELSLREIAEALVVGVGTVKARLYRARENLKRLLASCNSTDRGAAKQYGTAE